ncbi:hypothetical protein [Tropicibacter sp. Alg240-R139]|uniref:hypothetical protein n=1 Tax=Tropicibacter sp. Alg240-R139 TaxID=2305991 RepID=UPI0013DEA03E|nr:hypothetical protein [Tropicibacter sp. Alg240-R139]
MNTNKKSELSFLLNADIAARNARDRAIIESVPDAGAFHFVRRLLSNPTLRPLMELELNGCTSLVGALLLSSQEYVRTTRFRGRSARFRAREFEALEMTSLGSAALMSEIEGLEKNRWLGEFQTAVEGYVCIDHGAGICMSRPLFETALEIPDPEVLERVVFLNNGMRQIAEMYRKEEFIDAECRRDHSIWWSENGKSRKGVEVVDLGRQLAVLDQ